MKLKLFVAVVAAQFVFLLAWAGWHEYLRGSGVTILLDTRPIDPRDILRGDYMILSYKIGNAPLPADWSAREHKSSASEPIWVVLEKRGEFYEAVSSSLAQPASLEPNQVLVQGQLSPSTGRTRVTYGIEQYFVPEGKGTPRFKTLHVEATVSASHQLNIKRVILDGKTYP